jgi:hypothetical protein
VRRFSALDRSFLDCILSSPASSAVVVVSVLLLFLPAGLAGFHTYLVLLNRTTNEHLKNMCAARRCALHFARVT